MLYISDIYMAVTASSTSNCRHTLTNNHQSYVFQSDCNSFDQITKFITQNIKTTKAQKHKKNEIVQKKEHKIIDDLLSIMLRQMSRTSVTHPSQTLTSFIYRQSNGIHLNIYSRIRVGVSQSVQLLYYPSALIVEVLRMLNVATD